MASVRPIRARARSAAPAVAKPAVAKPPAMDRAESAAPRAAPAASPARKPAAPPVRPAPIAAPPRPKPGTTLDGSWDKQLSRGLVSPDRSIDLHGHNLASAHALLDSALEHAVRDGDRVLLLVTGKPPLPSSARPHARGAIRAAVGDWLAGSRHAGAIAAVRGAHPRHGGSGALYIILRRARDHRKS
jgi:DNA-nicking Smr family endonuclease